MNNQILTGKARLLPSSSEMVLDPGPRGTVNVDMSRAVASPELDARGFVAADMGAARIGEAVGQVGGALGKLAMVQMQAINLRKEAEADDLMDAAKYSMAEEMAKERDETKWDGIAAKHIGTARSGIEKMALAPAVKEAVSMKADRWAMHQEGQTKVLSARESIQKAGQKINDKLGYAEASQDALTFEHTLKGAVSAGYLSEEAAATKRLGFTETGERIQRESTAKAEKSTLEAVLSTAQIDPEKAEEQVNAKDFGKGLSPMVKEQAKDMIRGVRRDQFADVQQAVFDGIASDEVKTDTDIDRVINTLAPKGVRESDRAYLKGKLKEFSGDAMKAEAARPEAISERFGKLLDAVDKYDRASLGGTDSKEARDAYAAIHIEATLLPEKLRGDITEPLSHKWKAGGIGINGTVKEYVDESIKDLYDNGGFGTTATKGVNALGNDAIVTDIEGQKSARARRADATIAMKEWMTANPDAKREEATAALYRLSGQTLNIQDAAQLLNGANKQTTVPAAPVDWKNLLNKLSGKTDSVRGFSDAADLKDTLPTALRPHAQDYLDAAKEHGLNPRVLAAISALETGGGTSKAFREKMNAMGISDSSGPTEQPSVRDSIFRQAKTLSKADGPYAKAKTIEEIGAIYAPPGAENDPRGTNGGWPDGVRAWLSRL